MTEPRLLTDEHIPEAVIRVLESLGHDVVPAKHVLPEGADDGQLLSFSRDHDRTVLTADMQFTIVDGTVITNHAGVIFAPQSMLQSRPADAGEAVNRILELVPPDERVGKEFYLEHWLDRR